MIDKDPTADCNDPAKLRSSDGAVRRFRGRPVMRPDSCLAVGAGAWCGRRRSVPARSRTVLLRTLVMTIPIWQFSMQAPRLTLLPGTGRDGTVARATATRRLCPIRSGRVGLTVEFAGFAEAEAASGEWAGLLDRALEPNIFMDPAFALPASQHFAETRRPLFVLVRDGADPRRTLLGVWLLEARPAALSPGFVSGWRCDHAVLGMPLIDRMRAADVADAMLDAVAARFGSRTVLVLPKILRQGPTYGLVLSRALATNRSWGTLSAHARAVLHANGSGAASPQAVGAGRGRKELGRQRRRLAELGDLQFRSVVGGEPLRTAIERFLALEESGWKGRRETALLSDPGSSTFLRAMVRLMAREGKCRIDSLELDGRPIAMAIVLASHGRAYFWKTAYAEAFRSFSPGVQLTLDLTRVQLADPSILVTDSCAVADHPMIDRLWPDRQELVDFAIAVSPEAGHAAGRAMRRERLRRAVRETLKRLLRRNPKPSSPTPTLLAGVHAPMSKG